MAWTTPTDRTTGYVVLASDWNVVEDDLTFLYGDTAWTGAAAQGFTNSWGNAAVVCQFRRIGTRVFMQGGLANGTTGTAAFTLPSGYRPTATRNFPLVQGGGTLAFATISSAGVVTPTMNIATSNGCYFDAVNFDTI